MTTLREAATVRTPGLATLHLHVSAGEPSGDQYAAAVARAVLQVAPNTTLRGMGGPGMQAAGVDLQSRIQGLTAMGLVEVISKIPAHLRVFRETVDGFRAQTPDAAVLVDYPGYHLRLARELKRCGVPTLQFVAPKLWAWGASRARAYREALTLCATIFPFENAHLGTLGIPAKFVGHPVMDVPVLSREEARTALGIAAGRRVLALFPGSRSQELDRHWAPFHGAARAVSDDLPDLDLVVAAQPGLLYPSGTGARIVTGQAETVMAAADAVLCKSGTCNLLAARLGIPMVVAYKTHPLTYQVARRVVRTPSVSPVNILAGARVVPEFLQHDANVTALRRAVRGILEDPEVRAAQTERFEEITTPLGPLDAAGQVAHLAMGLAARRSA